MSIALMTFDIFGTVVDWRRGLSEAVPGGLTDAQFEAVIDRQGALEGGRFRPYAELVAQSLVDVLGLNAVLAARIGAEAGRWPIFPDSAEALRRLQAVAPCMATTNSDRAHGEDVQAQLGFRLSFWLSAEEARAYKPSRAMWVAASRKTGVPFSKDWWHVSAYADYDLKVAAELGLTTVLVKRPHHRPGPADLVVPDLSALNGDTLNFPFRK